MGMEQLPCDAPVLRWGIKRTFISYLSRLPDGSVSADSGASIVSGSYFQFAPDGGGPAGEAGSPADPRTAEDPTPAGIGTAGIRRFRGQVRLSGHHGMMSLFVADPWLEFDAEGAVLSVADPGQAPGSGARLELLRLAVPKVAGTQVAGPEAAGTDWTELPAQLAPAAVDLFNGQYAAGEEMDPVFLGPA
ncbi:hypothetical protein SRABI26_04158 [Arthrobacter sp. Bi26]|uniref:HtaA domain-containing protein n=1 Tax=Arthrobacter sp. Bi26 TaxID=2822350 RepID=UPI001DF4A867|nr:HtaA domain-containing protein [Arthrobacter sp. Bi26]CAH0288569.1 hypothetical protein SRABI26_04158 [Arthrobacter sp. Bi26]